MRASRELGLKITAAQREYYRYTGLSADVEKRGVGHSHPERAWDRSTPQKVAPSPGTPPKKN